MRARTIGRPDHGVVSGAWRRTALALAAVVISAATGGGAPAAVTTAAAAQAPAEGGCTEAGTISVTPGLTTVHRRVTFTFTGRAIACRLSDASIRSGRESGSGDIDGSCTGGAATGAEAISWDNGRGSVIIFTESFSGALATLVGTVTSGEFAGSRVRGADVIAPADPTACASAGVRRASYQGRLQIGG